MRHTLILCFLLSMPIQLSCGKKTAGAPAPGKGAPVVAEPPMTLPMEAEPMKVDPTEPEVMTATMQEAPPSTGDMTVDAPPAVAPVAGVTGAGQRLEQVAAALRKAGSQAIDVTAVLTGAAPELAAELAALKPPPKAVVTVIELKSSDHHALLVRLSAPGAATCAAPDQLFAGVFVQADKAGQESVRIVDLPQAGVRRIFAGASVAVLRPVSAALDLFEVKYKYEGSKDGCADPKRPVTGKFIEVFSLRQGSLVHVVSVPEDSKETTPEKVTDFTASVSWNESENGPEVTLLVRIFSEVETRNPAQADAPEGTISCTLALIAYVFELSDLKVYEGKQYLEFREGNPALAGKLQPGAASGRKACSALGDKAFQ